MREVVQTLSATGVTAPVPMDQYISPFNVGLGVIVSGTVSYTVQHTFDDPFASNFDPSTATWFNHTDLTSQSTSQDGNYAFPVRAIRLNATITGTGSATIKIAQAGI